MKLRVNLIANGKYYPAGVDIDEADVQAFAMRFHQAAEEEEEESEPRIGPGVLSPSSSDEKPKLQRKPKRNTFVLRGGNYIPLSELNDRMISLLQVSHSIGSVPRVLGRLKPTSSLEQLARNHTNA